ncbi:methionine gamma-lyase family protein [Tindallia californiensis]|uniref:Cystathionine beta-lyase family protein involved in aluminum resistance n=1 Tax=Tindallia californiensis TaxID=159292 RepID=A0A1H3NL22_9FIRM|nr:methionine gamma-lyase family protein [Tindallia californiensis]SDY89657.1 Cystathionine beta-lyase family protein involved in aluminum resistance [Tindallia californiensis]
MSSMLINNYQIDAKIIKDVEASEKQLASIFMEYDHIKEENQYKVIHAMQKHQLSDQHFNWTTGYGYNDLGREKVESIFAEAFDTEDALVRPNIVNGTHAISLCLTSLLNPGECMISITGPPYDTLHSTIGLEGNYPHSLKKLNIEYEQIELKENGSINEEEVEKKLESLNPKMVYLQRSTGYSFRPAITIEKMKHIIELVKIKRPDSIVMVDNCYGEFLETKEPTSVGADIMAGSLIKNPGGGIVLTGGYIAGRASLIELVSQRLTAPGIGKECGLTFGTSRTVLQGFFLAPNTVSEAVKGAILASHVFRKYNYFVNPTPEEKRSDIIQAIQLNCPQKLMAFCKGIQEAAPVDAFVKPMPWSMPGYKDQVIMAAGAFIQGSSIELSADGPMRSPYNVYLQGGLTYTHSKLGTMKALNHLNKIV